MRLKRGLERESCDFCHGRKVKCDRVPRAGQGHSACSQCALRDIQCRLDDSNDVRLRKRRQQQQQQQQEGHHQQGQHHQVQQNGRGDIADRATQAAAQRRMASIIQHTGLVGVNSPDPLVSAIAPLSAAPLSAPPPNQDDLLLDFPFELSAESILFLDQVFMKDYGAASTWDASSNNMHHYDTLPSAANTTSSEQEEHIVITGRDETGRSPPTWLSPDLNSSVFMAALDAYFTYAASSLPIIFEDAFWVDYNAGRCSRSLVYAVACRGMPFTAAADKWDIQQRAASHFRDAFLAAQQVSQDGEGAIRLDDIEALALMVDFAYDDSAPSLHSSLGNLFLKHDSLVLMTLQSRIQDGELASSDSAALARASERRVLLFWRIYGLDAFHCLDQKKMSRINDDEADLSAANSSRLEPGSYLDCILSLAVIARRIMQTMCSVAAKRKGIKHGDVLALYGQLDDWRRNACPPHLQRRKDTAGRLAPGDGQDVPGAAAREHADLQRTVTWLLEVNCHLQIESCVGDYGLQDGASLQAEAVALRVESESVQALNTGLEVLDWVRRSRGQGQGPGFHPPADLAPAVVRNIWAGMCFWSCLRGIQLCHGRAPALQYRQSPAQGGQGQGQGQGRARDSDEADSSRARHLHSYVHAAQMLRDEVATASSHRDTQDIVSGLDEQIGRLKDAIMAAGR